MTFWSKQAVSWRLRSLLSKETEGGWARYRIERNSWELAGMVVENWVHYLFPVTCSPFPEREVQYLHLLQCYYNIPWGEYTSLFFDIGLLPTNSKRVGLHFQAEALKATIYFCPAHFPFPLFLTRPFPDEVHLSVWNRAWKRPRQ